MTKKMQQNIIFMVLILGGFLFVFLKYLLPPLNRNYTDKVAQLEQTESRLAEMKQRALALPQLQADMKLLEAEVTDLEKFLPKEKEVSSLLKTVTNIAQRHGVRIVQFAPGAAVPKENYNELPYLLTVKGTYHSIARFMTDIGQGARILSTKDAVFSFVPSTDNKESTDTVSVNFTLLAYTFKG